MLDGLLAAGRGPLMAAPIQVERMGREVLLARRLAESERRAAWWRSQGDTDAADRYAAEARDLRKAVREFSAA